MEYDFKHAAERLWSLLDDIDTLDDACKEDDTDFRRKVRAVLQVRFDIAASDGQSLLWKPQPTQIFMLWVNDDVIATYETKVLAQRAAQKFRDDNPCRGGWMGGSERWFQREGRIARLEIDPRTVMSHAKPSATWPRYVIDAAERQGKSPEEVYDEFLRWLDKER